MKLIYYRTSSLVRNISSGLVSSALSIIFCATFSFVPSRSNSVFNGGTKLILSIVKMLIVLSITRSGISWDIIRKLNDSFFRRCQRGCQTTRWNFRTTSLNYHILNILLSSNSSVSLKHISGVPKTLFDACWIFISERKWRKIS